MFTTDGYDPRLVRLPMGSSPIPTILISLAYLILVTLLGPMWMRKKKPLDLRGLLIIHNFTLVILSVWMFYKFGRYGWFWRYNWLCAKIDFLETEESLEIVRAGYVFYLSKFLEMLDTVFFILRKKNSQITFLHVVHHASVPVLLWFFGGLSASGFNTMFGFLNSFVHIFMYLYYGLAAIGPSIHKYLWWKKYLTKLQIVQFCLIAMATVSAVVTPGCDIPVRIIINNLIIALFFLALFANFYRQAYSSETKENISQQNNQSSFQGKKLNKALD